MNFKLKAGSYNLPVKIIGNPKGQPILYLHGGPGYLCGEPDTDIFDLRKFKVILLQQRGAVLSGKPGCIEDNTTQLLIEDLEALRKKLDLETWSVYGQSWGSFLALHYAISYPDVISHLFIKGIFLGRKQDIDWIYDANKLGSYSTEIKSHFHQLMLSSNSEDNIKLFANKILTPEADIQACINWALWEDLNCGTSNEDTIPTVNYSYQQVAYAISRIEVFYFLNHCFVEENFILKNLNKIKAKTLIFQGTEDRICPQNQAQELHSELINQGKDSKIFLIENCGHSTNENMVQVIYQETKKLFS